MLESKENYVKIEGILSEIDLKKISYNKNGGTMDAISGSIKVRVEQKLNNKNTVLDIPVYIFANKLKNNGQPNPAYASTETIMNEYKSIAAVGIDAADRIRINGANIRMNEYVNNNNNVVAFPRINASFVSKIYDASKFSPEATFSAIFAVAAAGFAHDADGVEIPDRYIVKGILPQYGGNVDVIDFVANNPNVIDAVSSYWEPGDTVKVNGKLNFTSAVEEKTVQVDFGEPRTEKRTVTISELVITGGSQTPLEGDFAFDGDEIQAALTARQERLAQMKENAKNKTSGGSAKKATPAKKTFADLGF